MKEVKMERKIGEIFEYNGEWYQTVEAPIDEHSCNGCQGCKGTGGPRIFGGECNGNARKDNTFVTFKKLEKVGEPYMLEDKKFQKYKVFKTPYIYHKIDYSWQSFACPYYVSLEIKQTKENMEEKKQCGDNRFRTIAKAKEHLFQTTNIAEDKKELDVLDSFLLRCWQMGWLKQYEDANEKNLKPFDLEAAKAGKPVCTRDGRKARIICFDVNNDKPIVAVICCKDGKETYPYTFYPNGLNMDNNVFSNTDLMMLAEKKEGWVNVYKSEFDDFPAVLGAGYVYNTKEEAINNADPNIIIATVKIEWRE